VTTIHHGLDVNVPTTQAAPGQTGEPQAKVQAQPSGVSAPAEVEITPTAQLLATLEQQIAAAPEVNESRIDPIRQALSNGSYQVDAGRVADGLLAAQKFDSQATRASGLVTQSNSAKAFADTAQLGSERSG
jgi:negative regulator of flagellin synthesis FlgM